MTPFSFMSSTLWGAIGTWMLFLFFGFVFLETFAVIARQKHNRYGYPVILVVLYCMMQSVLWLTEGDVTADSLPLPVRFYVNLPWGVILLLCVAFTISLIHSALRCHAWQKENITNMSVKYAVDAFPEGICCYENSGRILLKNRAMERFCRLITGESLRSGSDFHGRICRSNLLSGCEVQVAGEDQLLVVAGGKAFSVTKKPLKHGAETLNFLVAADISEEYHKTEELLLRQKQVRKLNEKLRGYHQEISAVIAARETLNAKVKIHDELGLSLLASKRYILAGGSEEEKQAIVSGLKQQIRYLRSEQDEEETDEYSQLLLAANDLAIQIRQEGTLPEQAVVKHIFVTAIHECVTNTIRHAHGDTVQVCLHATEDAFVERITNNGERPQGPILEKDGLSSLREMVVTHSGQMKVRTEDGFALEIVLPKEGLDEI